MEQPRRRERTYRSVRSIFAVYAVVSLVPVLLLGAVLLTLQNRQGDQHGLTEGRAKADLLARTSIAPLLTGHDLRAGLSPAERAALQRSVTLAVKDQQVLRLRLRDLDGRVVFADDGSSSLADDEALDAAHGRTVAGLSRLDADSASASPGDVPGPARRRGLRAAAIGPVRPERSACSRSTCPTPRSPTTSPRVSGPRPWPSSVACCSCGSACWPSRPR